MYLWLASLAQYTAPVFYCLKIYKTLFIYVFFFLFKSVESFLSKVSCTLRNLKDA